MAELREFVLQFAVFQGFPMAVEFELVLNELEKSYTKTEESDGPST